MGYTLKAPINEVYYCNSINVEGNLQQMQKVEKVGM